MVVTNDDNMATSLRSLRDHGRIVGKDEVSGYGFNSRLDNLHAAILNVKFKYLQSWISRRREIASMYNEGLKDIPEIQLPPATQTGRYFDTFQNYVIRTGKRDELYRYLKDNGVEVLISWPLAMHLQPALKLSHFKLPETEAISREVLSLPMYPELTDEQVEYVVNVVSRFFKGK
jgi:dTDP-4-amino-4,6-dideoxygalactose transaminase